MSIVILSAFSPTAEASPSRASNVSTGEVAGISATAPSRAANNREHIDDKKYWNITGMLNYDASAEFLGGEFDEPPLHQVGL
ncbi:hypothetical protein [Streptomyces sp. NPDC019539]|uniref:hypothetical protein n=1 Tax=Streptomyces sp. NPDC019539 TaxID=3365063 RepID=UPI0037B970EC